MPSSPSTRLRPQTRDELSALHVAGARFVDGPGGLTALQVDTEQCEATVFLHGAHVARWAPAGERPVLHLSPRSTFADGKAIRGGIPVCFPWFASRTDDPRPTGAPSPNHGLLRTRSWHVEDLALEDNGRVRITLHTREDEDTHALWPHAFEATLVASLGTTLTVTLDVLNTGDSELLFEEALHTYLEVGDVERAQLVGLEAGRWIDKVDGGATRQWDGGPFTLRGEVDAIFPGSKAAITVVDPVLQRHLRVEKTGSRTTVVWNPGLVRAQTAPDIGGEAWRSFVCVESANTLPHAVPLPPGARHVLSQKISVIPQRPHPESER